MSIMSDVADEFVVSGEWSVPDPLDKYLATLTIRNTSNDLTKFNVVLNANFGKTRVQIEVDDTEMELDCELQQAEIRLYYNSNCALMFGKGYQDQTESRQTDLEQRLAVSSELAAAIKTDVQIDQKTLNAIIKGSTSAAKNRSSESTIISKQTLLGFSHIQLDTVSVTGDPLRTHLSGREVSEYEGWAGRPKSNGEKIGVGATILMKEEWIKFSNVRVKRSGHLGEILKAILSSPKSKKADQFKILLAYLTRKTLQDPSEKSTQHLHVVLSCWNL
jgi:hypothetical protein